jgi:hypothetical protein
MGNAARKERKKQWSAANQWAYDPDDTRPAPEDFEYRMSTQVTEELLQRGAVDYPAREIEGFACPEVTLIDPHASQLADLETIIHDLRFVLAACAQRLDIQDVMSHATDPSSQESLRVAARALTEASIITYGRCFGNGASAVLRGSRATIPDEVMAELSNELRAAHDDVLELRNHHVAHRINDFVKVEVSAILNPVELSDCRVIDINERILVVVPGMANATKLKNLAETLIPLLVERRANMRRSMVEALQNMAGADLYAHAANGTALERDSYGANDPASIGDELTGADGATRRS